MYDRNPDFKLYFRDYRPSAETRLDRHGPLRSWSTQRDLRDLVTGLQEQGIKVAIGFWSYGGWWFLPKTRWLREHPELKRLPGSSDLYPFVRLKGEETEYAEYIAHQYERIKAGFGFDGLMLGDGLCGFGSFRNPDQYRDTEEAIPLWTRFYVTIAEIVHRSQGLLLAYDRMGFSYGEAREHGVDYRELAHAGLDFLVYQSYPQAWGKYWLAGYRDRFDLKSSVRNLATVKAAQAGTPARLFYTLELGDSVEKWVAQPDGTDEQMAQLDPLADGRFLVWANDLFAQRNPMQPAQERTRRGL
jgi:hypothetical protein